jgi:hypothetical protein
MERIFRQIRNPGSNSVLPPKPSEPPPKETGEGFSGTRPVSGLKPKEGPLAGYLLARAALHRKIEGPVLRNLRAGHASVQEVNELLPLGRSNVREDLGKPQGQFAHVRALASNQLQEALAARQKYPPGTDIPEIDTYRMTAAISQYALTGTCLSYAANTTSLHAAKLAGMQDERAIVAQANHPILDHVWSEMIPRGMGKDGKPILHGEDVIMDGWCKDNLAILREDSHFARLDRDGKGEHLSHDHLLDPRSGPEDLHAVEKFKAEIEESRDLRETFQRKLNRYIAAGTEPDEDLLWEAQSVFLADFRQQAGAALRPDALKAAPGRAPLVPDADAAAIRAKQASLDEIRAVGVARDLGSNVRGAIADAPAILASARDLFPGPKSNKRKRDLPESSG